MVDGASRLTALLRIVLPLSGPALVVVAVFAFTLSWSEFLYAFVLIQSPSRMTAPVGLFSYLKNYNEHSIAASNGEAELPRTEKVPSAQEAVTISTQD